MDFFELLYFSNVCSKYCTTGKKKKKNLSTNFEFIFIEYLHMFLKHLIKFFEYKKNKFDNLKSYVSYYIHLLE